MLPPLSLWLVPVHSWQRGTSASPSGSAGRPGTGKERKRQSHISVFSSPYTSVSKLPKPWPRLQHDQYTAASGHLFMQRSRWSDRGAKFARYRLLTTRAAASPGRLQDIDTHRHCLYLNSTFISVRSPYPCLMYIMCKGHLWASIDDCGLSFPK